MLSFFRKVRYNLIERKNFGKYFRYAIGEIILVVIGILIALSINNWNEKKQILKTEQNILKTLKTEMESNLDQLERYMKGNKTAIDGSILCLSLFGNNVDHRFEQKLDSALWHIELLETFHPRRGTLNSLIASGQINYIRNEDLKTLLTYFSDEVSDLNEEENGVQRLLDDRFWPIIDKYVNSSHRSRLHYDNFPEGSYKSDYQSFFKNKELENVISNILVWRYDMQGEQVTLKQSIKRMLELIDQEIK